MFLHVLALLLGLALLCWSADRFVEGAAASAKNLGVPPLLIGMVIVGFGTSAPEMVVSVISSWQGNSGIAIGNAYGSNIVNIALILGIVAIIRPITVHSRVLTKELPILTLVTGYALLAAWNMEITHLEGWIHLAGFAVLVGWSVMQGLRQRHDALGEETEDELLVHGMPLSRAVFWLIAGLLLLVVSSRVLVWAAVHLARDLGVSDIVTGLTIVALGTSLPELASSIAAVRKNEHDIALGNIIGSNLFNTLAVVGIAAAIQPLTFDSVIVSRDLTVMTLLTLSLFFCFRLEGSHRISRSGGVLLFASYIGYISSLVMASLGTR